MSIHMSGPLSANSHCPPSDESRPATAYKKPYTTVLTFREIVSQSLQLSQKAMGLAINTAICQASFGSPRRLSSTSHAHLEEGPPATDEIIIINKNNNDNNNDGDGTSTGAGAGAGAATAMAAAAGDAPTENPSAVVDLESVSRLLADSYTDRYADVEVMLGCYRLIGKIADGVG